MRTARKLLHPRQLIRLTPLSIQFPDFPKNHDVTSSTILAAYATTIPDKDHGASELTPKEDPKILGWDPNSAEEDAPGQEAEGQHCIGPRSRSGSIGIKDYRTRLD